jgi:hypothetical protein
LSKVIALALFLHKGLRILIDDMMLLLFGYIDDMYSADNDDLSSQLGRTSC